MRRAGFTLVELIVVLWVVMLASLLIVPGFLRFHRANQLRMAGMRTLALAAEARGLAVERDAPVRLRFDTAFHGLRLVLSRPPALPPDPRHPHGEAPLPPGASLAATNPDGRVLEYPLDVDVKLGGQRGKETDELTFLPDGRAIPAKLTLTGEGLAPIALATNPRTGRLLVTADEPK